jgi:uncharacterized protein (TIGR03435 family)
MTNRISFRLTLAKQLLLATGGMAAVVGPVLVGILNAPRSRAQSKPEGLTFEVASVKLSSDQQRQRGSTGNPPPTRGNQGILTYSQVHLLGVLATAYDVLPYEVVGPSRLGEKLYDIVAKLPQGARAEQIPAMLQNLLAERFRMRVHWDAQQKAGYALVVGKTGSKLKKSASGPDGAPDRSESFTMGGPETHVEFKGTTLKGFGKSLTILLVRPVEDMTGIEGVFDIAFDCSTDSIPRLRPMAASEDLAVGPSILTAIRGLGLDLVSQKVPVKRLVVDSAEAIPTEN